MKKALSLVLALVMVLSMAVVGFAADSATYTIDGFKADSTKATITVKPTAGATAVSFDNVKAFDANGAEITGFDVEEDDINLAVGTFDPTGIAALGGEIVVTFASGDYNIVVKETIAAEAAEVQDEVYWAVLEAISSKTTEVVIDATNLDNATLTETDIAFITNSYEDSWDWTAALLGFEVTVINYSSEDLLGNPVNPVIFDLGLIDYTWTKAIDFSFYTSDVVTPAQYAMIRTLTGDTKNPLVFGFSGSAVPAGTEVDMVIPQAWINYYGHKNLTLFAWTAPITATVDNGANAGSKITLEDAKVLAETVLDVNTTVTQRIQFTTDTLYKTLVLSANATPVEDGAASENTQDANPNTGANDIVNVAVVFAVVSLAAAGALVCKKSK